MILYWTPRILSMLFIAFLSLFALDVFSENLGFWQTIQALVMHLVPSIVLVIGLVVAWRWEWVGSALYALAGGLYVWWVVSMSRPVPAAVRFQWALVIAGPAFVISALFLANWRHRLAGSGSGH